MKKISTSILILTFFVMAVIFTLSSCNDSDFSTTNAPECQHQWVNADCMFPKTCRICGKAEGEPLGHVWKDATCTTPKTCSLCNKTEGVALGHTWQSATCTEPKTCKICQVTEGSAKGHAEGDWITTKKATLTTTGEETLSCSVCDKLLDSRSVKKKLPKVEDDYFNFTDKELIDWINENSTTSVGYTDIEIFEETSSNTSYRITSSDGETGALLLNHGDNGKDGNIQAIMVHYSDDSYAAALGMWIGYKIDSDFDPDDAAFYVVLDEPYTAADMTLVRLELEEDFEVYLLAPFEFMADYLS